MYGLLVVETIKQAKEDLLYKLIGDAKKDDYKGSEFNPVYSEKFERVWCAFLLVE